MSGGCVMFPDWRWLPVPSSFFALRDKHGRPQQAACQGVGDTKMLIRVGVLTPLVCLSVLLPPSLSPLHPHSILTLFLFPSKELIKPKEILGHPVERPMKAAAIGAAGAVGAANECPGPGARGVGVKNHRCQVC